MMLIIRSNNVINFSAVYPCIALKLILHVAVRSYEDYLAGDTKFQPIN